VVVLNDADLACPSVSHECVANHNRHPWWRNAHLLAECQRLDQDSDHIDWYRIGKGELCVQSDDTAFRKRLSELFESCRVQSPTGDAPSITCKTQHVDRFDLVTVSYDDPEPLDVVPFALETFSNRGCYELDECADGWRTIGFAGVKGPTDLFAISGNHVVAHADSNWRWLVGSLAVNRLLRLQRKVVFFHAAAVADGSSGILLVGPKNSGKTTLSLALATRGTGNPESCWRFLGDELVGVDTTSKQLVPVRRAVSLRQGPRTPAIERALTNSPRRTERFPDGTPRVWVNAWDWFPEPVAGDAPKLTTIIFLEGFDEAPSLHEVASDTTLLSRLTPVLGARWQSAPGRRVVELLGIIAEAQCFLLTAGEPTKTAELIESRLEA